MRNITLQDYTTFIIDYKEVMKNPQNKGYRVGQHYCNFFKLRYDEDKLEPILWGISDVNKLTEILNENNIIDYGF